MNLFGNLIETTPLPLPLANQSAQTDDGSYRTPSTPMVCRDIGSITVCQGPTWFPTVE